mmetsp:Transcript_212/g.556  ORF Transcript_212/g.556 Transcript_212/m.556 type:complete len:141 (+) Transcript_212:934-1356(+)
MMANRSMMFIGLRTNIQGVIPPTVHTESRTMYSSVKMIVQTSSTANQATSGTTSLSSFTVSNMKVTMDTRMAARTKSESAMAAVLLLGFSKSKKRDILTAWTRGEKTVALDCSWLLLAPALDEDTAVLDFGRGDHWAVVE